MVIIASAGKAEVALRQRIGRGLRARKIKPIFVLSLILMTLITSSKNHAQQRRAIIESTDGFKEHIVEDFDYSLLNSDSSRRQT